MNLTDELVFESAQTADAQSASITSPTDTALLYRHEQCADAKHVLQRLSTEPRCCHGAIDYTLTCLAGQCVPGKNCVVEPTHGGYDVTD